MTHSEAKAKMRLWTTMHSQMNLKKSCAQSLPKLHADIAMDPFLIATEISLVNGKLNKQNLARETLLACGEEYAGLRRIFTEEQMEKMREIY